jgi:hypothetical protein
MQTTFSRLMGRIWPLLFFSLPGVLVALAGIGVGYFWVLRIFISGGGVAIGSAVLAVGLIVSGLTALFAGLTLYSIACLSDSRR